MATGKGNTRWLALAMTSGACAAFNGVFAKLTTTKLTATWAASISRLSGYEEPNPVVEYVIRAMCFSMNLTFNVLMWALFTRALALATSAVRVSVINTSSNFVVTALLGALVFKETLPSLWWLGASMLVTGSVIIGRREEDTLKPVDHQTQRKDSHERQGEELNGYRDEPVEDDAISDEGDAAVDSVQARKKPVANIEL